MIARHKVQLVPCPVSDDDTFDLPANHGPIVAVEFGPHPRNYALTAPRMVWWADVVEVYEDAEPDEPG